MSNLQCMTCLKDLVAPDFIMFELSLEEGVPVRDAKLTAKGFVCKDLLCLATATGCVDE